MEDDEDDVYLDIGFRQNTPEQNYIMQTVRLQDLANRTLGQIREMLNGEPKKEEYTAEIMELLDSNKEYIHDNPED